jgi:hypothetical protein
LTPPRELFYNLMVVHLCETFVASNFFDKKFVTKPFSIALSKKSVARLVEKFNHGLEKLGTLTGGEHFPRFK